jgi:hypothetical protein
MCGWAVRYPISEGDLTGNRGVCLWVRCAGGCGGYAFMAGVYPGDWKPDVPVGIVNYADAREAALFATLGIRWEDA